MTRLTLLYDAKCGFCVTCRHWLGLQPKFVEVDFVPARSAASAKQFPGLELPEQPEELTVVADTGEVWKGTKAWLISLWALVEYREWAERLSTPALMPLARGLFAVVGSQRKRLSGLLGLKAEDDVIEELRNVHVPRCTSDDGIPMAQIR
ncbi:MAG: DCC1-like thiol-disulfide oxidoreductase family protein [Planctomycetota bacterium]